MTPLVYSPVLPCKHPEMPKAWDDHGLKWKSVWYCPECKQCFQLLDSQRDGWYWNEVDCAQYMEE